MKKLIIGIVLSIAMTAGAETLVFNATRFGALGEDPDVNHATIQAALDVAKTSSVPIKVCMPSGTYPVSRCLHIYSDTELHLRHDTEILRSGSADHVMLYAMHVKSGLDDCEDGALCTHGGYSQFQNITVSGGVWDAASAENETTGILHLSHGDGIVVSNATFKGCTDHMLNLSGSKNIKVVSCAFADAVRYTGTDPEYWGEEYGVGNTNRYNTIECLHLDLTSHDGEAGNYPEDDTPCENVEVSNCRFENVFAGVGNHHIVGDVRIAGLEVAYCDFLGLQGYSIYAFGFTNCVAVGNVCSNGMGLLRASHGRGVVHENFIAQAGNDAVFLIDGSDYSVLSNTIVKATREGVNLYDSSAYVEGNQILDSGDCAVRSDLSHKVQVRGNEIAGCGAHGVSVTDTELIEAFDNAIGDCIGNGVVVTGSVAKIAGNELTGCQVNGVRIGALSTATIANNRIVAAGQHGIVAAEGAVVDVLENAIESPSQAGIWLFQPGQCCVNSNTVSNCGDSGLILVEAATPSTKAEVAWNTLEKCGSHGMRFDNVPDADVGHNRIHGTVDQGVNVIGGKVWLEANEIISTGKNGVNVKDNLDISLEGNVIGQIPGYGICLDGGSDYSVRCNTITNTAKSAVYMKAVTGATIEGNVLSVIGATNGDHPVYADSCVSCTVAGNEISDTKGKGVCMLNCNGMKVLDNSISGTAGEGIYCKNSVAVTINCNEVLDAGFIAIRVEGIPELKASASVINNTAHALTNYDIRICDDCENCTVKGSTCLGTGVYVNLVSADTTTIDAAVDPSVVKETHDTPATWTGKDYSYAAYVPPAADERGIPPAVKSEKADQPGPVAEEEPPLPLDYFHVGFDANGGDGAMETVDVVVGEIYALPTCGFMREGYVFSGWQYRNGAVWETGLPGAELPFTPVAETTVMLKAQWIELPPEPEYFHVDFNANGGLGAMARQDVLVGGVFVLPECGFTCEGFNFVGWEYANGTAMVTALPGAALAFAPAAETTVVLKALWEEIPPEYFHVGFNANGGSGTMATVDVEVGKSYTLPSCGFIRKNYKFTGWQFDNGSGKSIGAPGEQVALAAAEGQTVTLVAQWNLEYIEPTPVPSQLLSKVLANAAVLKGEQVVGLLQITVAKSDKNHQSKLTANLYGLDGKKIAAKAEKGNVEAVGSKKRVKLSRLTFKDGSRVNLTVGADGSVSGTFADGRTLEGVSSIGRAGSSSPKFVLEGSVSGIRGLLNNEVSGGRDYHLVPDGDGVKFKATDKKWIFSKNASVKYKKNKATKRMELVVDTGKDGSKTNLSSLKLSCAAKTGILKGSFVLYVNAGDATKPKLKKLKATVTGVVLGGEGYGIATVKGVGSWPIAIRK